MDIEAAIPLHCKTDAVLNALIDGRIYYDTLPDKCVLPAVTFFRVSGARDHVTDLRSPRFQFTAWAATKPEAGKVEEAVEDAFIRFKGPMGGEPVVQCVIDAPGYDLPAEADSNGTRYGRACDIRIIYRGG